MRGIGYAFIVCSDTEAASLLDDLLIACSRTSQLAVCTGRSKKRRDDETDDGTLSRPRICKPLYGPSQGDETGD